MATGLEVELDGSNLLLNWSTCSICMYVCMYVCMYAYIFMYTWGIRYIRIYNEIVCTTEAYDTKYIVILEILIEQKRVVSVVSAVCVCVCVCVCE